MYTDEIETFTWGDHQEVTLIELQLLGASDTGVNFVYAKLVLRTQNSIFSFLI